MNKRIAKKILKKKNAWAVYSYEQICRALYVCLIRFMRLGSLYAYGLLNVLRVGKVSIFELNLSFVVRVCHFTAYHS